MLSDRRASLLEAVLWGVLALSLVVLAVAIWLIRQQPDDGDGPFGIILLLFVVTPAIVVLPFAGVAVWLVRTGHSAARLAAGVTGVVTALAGVPLLVMLGTGLVFLGAGTVLLVLVLKPERVVPEAIP